MNPGINNKPIKIKLDRDFYKSRDHILKLTMITLNLTEQETMDIFNVLGQLPTSSNAYQLYQKIGLQIKEQLETNKEIITDAATKTSEIKEIPSNDETNKTQ